jgi:hypothetical protein
MCTIAGPDMVQSFFYAIIIDIFASHVWVKLYRDLGGLYFPFPTATEKNYG